jgi:hypothetical protein
VRKDRKLSRKVISISATTPVNLKAYVWNFITRELKNIRVHIFIKKDTVYTTIVFLDVIHRPVLFKTQRFGDWILSPSSGGTYSVGPNR